jgi:hypothetical protein
MVNNEDNYLDKVTVKYNKAKEQFDKEYKPMVDYIMNYSGVDEETAIQKIQDSENLLKFGKTFSFNDKSIAPIVKTNLMNRPAEAGQIYEVRENGEISTKPRKATDELNKKDNGEVSTVEVDPTQGVIIMGTTTGKKYAIKAGKGSLPVSADKILKEMQEFTELLNTSKRPSAVLPTGEQGGNTGYIVVRNPENLQPAIYKGYFIDGKWKYDSNSPMRESDAYNELMQRLYLSLGGTNQINPSKI